MTPLKKVRKRKRAANISYKTEKNGALRTTVQMCNPVLLISQSRRMMSILSKPRTTTLKDNLSTEPNTSGIVIDLTIGKKTCQPRCKSTDEDTHDDPDAKSNRLDCNADFQTPQQDLNPEESASGTEQLNQVTGEQLSSEPSSL